MCVAVHMLLVMNTQTSKKDLLTLDFEGILNYFRVSLPKRFQTERQCQHLFHALRGFKVCYPVHNITLHMDG